MRCRPAQTHKHTLRIYKTVETTLDHHTLKHMFRDHYKEKMGVSPRASCQLHHLPHLTGIHTLSASGDEEKSRKMWHVFKAARLINHPQLMSNLKWFSACNHTEPWLHASACVCERSCVCLCVCVCARRSVFG